MLGLFSEVGPCTTDGKTTKRHAPSWSNKANLLFVDQPAGTGFSTATPISKAPISLAVAAQDFNTLLNVFYTSIFPTLSKRPLHFAGESFGGHYTPAFSKYILQKQKSGGPDAVPVKLESIILVNAAVDPSATALGHIDHFCSPPEKKGNGFAGGFNSTACTAMKRAAPDCEKQGQVCRDTYSVNNCKNSMMGCDNGVGKWFGSAVGPGGRNPYDGTYFKVKLFSSKTSRH
jgi:cathepsin A (carboxypeptidase C)